MGLIVDGASDGPDGVLVDGFTLGSIDGLYDGLRVGALVLDDTTTTAFTSSTINAINMFISYRLR